MMIVPAGMGQGFRRAIRVSSRKRVTAPSPPSRATSTMVIAYPCLRAGRGARAMLSRSPDQQPADQRSPGQLEGWVDAISSTIPIASWILPAISSQRPAVSMVAWPTRRSTLPIDSRGISAPVMLQFPSSVVRRPWRTPTNPLSHIDDELGRRAPLVHRAAGLLAVGGILGDRPCPGQATAGTAQRKGMPLIAVALVPLGRRRIVVSASLTTPRQASWTSGDRPKQGSRPPSYLS